MEESVPIFSMGIDTRTREQRRRKKHIDRRHHLRKYSINPVNYSFSFTTKPPFSYIPDIPKKYEILLLICSLLLHILV